MISQSAAGQAPGGAGPSQKGVHSMAAGDVVLCNPPPYNTQPWLSSGVVLHYALLVEAGVRTQVIRAVPPPFEIPRPIFEASYQTFLFDPSMTDRMDRMAAFHAEEPAFFDGMVQEVTAGGAQVFGLSVFRNNVDVGLWLARMIKDRLPGSVIIMGGPEAVEDPSALCLPWIDAVVGVNAEAVIVPLMQCALAGKLDAAAGLPNVWLNARFPRDGTDPSCREPLPTPAYPTIDYAPLVPLLFGDPEAAMPLLLNWGCPYHCGFCSNRNTYSRFEQGSVDRVLHEMDVVMDAWKSLHSGSAPPMNLQLSDATTNAIPAQFDTLMKGISARQSEWGKAHIRGQTLFDARITKERVQLMREARFEGTFFGLETASDDFRRALLKPGRISEVATALKVFHQHGGGRLKLNFGVPVGIPGESDAYFEETVTFVDWAMQFQQAIESVTILPYVFFRTAQDPKLNQLNTGDERGLLWRMDGPAGDPAVRARRYMRLFEGIDRRVETVSPVPPCLGLPAMLPEAEADTLEAWYPKYGRMFDQVTPTRVVHDSPPDVEDPALVTLWSKIESQFKTSAVMNGWRRVGFGQMGHGTTLGLVILFQQTEGRSFFAIRIDPPNRELAAFAHHPQFNLSYLENWEGTECIFDKKIMAYCMRLLDRPETDS